MRINKNQPQITQDFQLIPKTQHMNKITKYKLQDENEKLLNMLIEDEKAHCFAISFFIVKSKHVISFDSFTVGTSVINFYTKRSFQRLNVGLQTPGKRRNKTEKTTVPYGICNKNWKVPQRYCVLKNQERRVEHLGKTW